MINWDRAPSRSEAEQDAAWDRYFAGERHIRQAEFEAWCKENLRDPEDVGSAVDYEEEVSEKYANQ